MVVDEHPFNPVVKELGVIAFLTWKRKILMSGCKIGAACHLKMETKTYCTDCKLYSVLRV